MERVHPTLFMKNMSLLVCPPGAQIGQAARTSQAFQRGDDAAEELGVVLRGAAQVQDGQGGAHHHRHRRQGPRLDCPSGACFCSIACKKIDK